MIKKRIGHWGRILRAGFGTAYAAAGCVTLLVGGSVLLAVHWGREHVAWGVAAIAVAVVIALFEGSYRENRRLEEELAQKTFALISEHKSAIAELQEKLTLANRAQRIKFQDIRKGAQVDRTTFNNTYNEAGEPKAEEGGLIGILMDGGRIERSEVNMHFGPPLPLPSPRASTPEERASLCQQLLEISSKTEAVFSDWTPNRQAVAEKMGISADEFMARMDEILAERERINNAVTARYNRECRPDVMTAYRHARDIGYADEEMERIWKTEIGAGALHISARLKVIAGRIMS